MKVEKIDKVMLLFFIIPLIPYSIIMNEITNGVVFIILMGGITYSTIKQKQIKKLSRLESLIILLTLAIITISIINSKDRLVSLMYSFSTIALILGYYIAKNSDKKDADYAKSLILGGAVSSIMSIILHIGNTYDRLEGTFNYANTSAIFYGVCLMLLFAYYDEIKEDKYFIWYQLIAIILASVLFATESRGGIAVYLLAILLFKGKENYKDKMNINFIGIIFGILIIEKQFIMYLLLLPVIFYLYIQLGNSKKNRKIKIDKYIIILEIGSILAMLIIMKNRILSISINTPELQERLVIFQDAINLIVHNLLGVGSGNYNKVQFLYQSANYDVKYVHNGIIQFIVDYGVLIIIPLVMGIIFYYKKLKLHKKYTSPWFMVVAMILIHSLIDFSLSFIMINLLLGVAIALSIKSGKNNSCKLWIIPSGIFTIAILMVLIILPYEILFNYAINKSEIGTRTPYNVLKKLEHYVVKDNNLYAKLGGICNLRYDETNDENLLTEGLGYYEKYISKEPDDARAYENTSVIYFKLGKAEEGEKYLRETIEKRRFSEKPYEKLVDLYYANMTESLKDGSIEDTEVWIEKINNIYIDVDTVCIEQNTKSKYMKNQIQPNLTDNYKMIFDEVNNIKKYIKEKNEEGGDVE